MFVTDSTMGFITIIHHPLGNILIFLTTRQAKSKIWYFFDWSMYSLKPTASKFAPENRSKLPPKKKVHRTQPSIWRSEVLVSGEGILHLDGLVVS